MILPRRIRGTAIVIECKHSKKITDLVKDSKEGAKQIKEKRYLEGVKERGYFHAVGYGISFYKKQCYITKAD